MVWCRVFYWIVHGIEYSTGLSVWLNRACYWAFYWIAWYCWSESVSWIHWGGTQSWHSWASREISDGNRRQDSDDVNQLHAWLLSCPIWGAISDYLHLHTDLSVPWLVFHAACTCWVGNAIYLLHAGGRCDFWASCLLVSELILGPCKVWFISWSGYRWLQDYSLFSCKSGVSASISMDNISCHAEKLCQSHKCTLYSLFNSSLWKTKTFDISVFCFL